MNAKETLKKIAEALNIVGGEAEVNTEAPVVETVEEVKEEVATEAPAVEAVEEEAKEEVKEETVEATEPVEETEAKEVVEEVPSPENERVRELESQLADLKKILESAMTEPTKEEVPEVKQQEPKGLTHSPEKEVKIKSKGIGSKGMSIQERVYKYMNN